MYLVWISRNRQLSPRVWLTLVLISRKCQLSSHSQLLLNILVWLLRNHQPSPRVWLSIFSLNIKKPSTGPTLMTQYSLSGIKKMSMKSTCITQYIWYGYQENVNQVHLYDSIYFAWIPRNHQLSSQIWINIFGLDIKKPSTNSPYTYDSIYLVWKSRNC